MRLQLRRHCILTQCSIWIPTSRHLSSSLNRGQKEDRQRRDIVPGDLRATLEAHRASNRASIIRKVDAGKPALFKSLRKRSEALHLSSDDAPKGLDVGYSNDGGPFHQQKLSQSSESTQDSDLGETGEHASTNGKPPERKFAIYKSRDHIQSALPKDAHHKKTAWMMRKFHIIKSQSMTKTGQEVAPALYHTGRYIKPAQIFGDVSSTSFKPWETESSRTETDRSTRISKELVNLSKWLLLTPAEKTFRQNLTHATTYLLRRREADVKFYSFGSSETGLATTMSDIDIGFTIPSLEKDVGERGPSSGIGRPANRKMIYRLLDRFCVNSLTQPAYKDQQLVHARYPLLRMIHGSSQIEVQIVAGSPKPAVIEITKTHIDEYPQLVPVYLALKASLAARELDEPSTGGVGSYTLLMMIVGAFKISEMSRLAEPCAALLTALEFYGNFDTITSGIAIDQPQIFKKKNSFMLQSKSHDKYRNDPSLWSLHQLSVANEKTPYLLCLQDPADLDNDLGRRIWRIMDVLKTFKEMASMIKSWMGGKGALTTPTGMTPFEFLLGNSLNAVRVRRDSFRLWSFSPKGRYELAKNSAIAEQAIRTDQERQSFPSFDKYKTAAQIKNNPGSEGGSVSIRHEDHDEGTRYESSPNYKWSRVNIVDSAVSAQALDGADAHPISTSAAPDNELISHFNHNSEQGIHIEQSGGLG